MTDPDEGDVASLLRDAQGVGEAEVGVADHAEDVGDAPVHHRLHHQVRDGADGGLVGWQGHVDAVVADLRAVARGRVGEPGRGAPLQGE